MNTATTSAIVWNEWLYYFHYALLSQAVDSCNSIKRKDDNVYTTALKQQK